MKRIVASVLLVGCLTMAGCSLHGGGPLISDRVWVLDSKYPDEPVTTQLSQDYVPPVCTSVPSNTDGTTSAGQVSIRTCVDAMLQVIDVKWVHFQDQLLTSTSNSNFATDVALLGIGTAGSFVVGQATQILHAASAGITGIRSSVDSDLLYSATITTILLQMQNDRAAVRTTIAGRLAAPLTGATAAQPQPYANLYEAANDLFVYARAGSWTHALLSIQRSATNSAGTVPNAPAPVAPPPVAAPPAAPGH